MNLENLVPDRKLCEQIPDGCFENTALAWDTDYERWYVTEREKVEAIIGIPAPTLQEIMDALVLLCNEPVCFWMGGWHVKADLPYGELENYDMTSPVTAALKLWLEVNKTCKTDKTYKTKNQEK